MSEWGIVKALAGVAGLFGLCAWVFPTKEKVNKVKDEVDKACHECRKEVYAKISEKANADDVRRLEAKVDNIAPKINAMNENIVRLTTIVELKLGVSKNDSNIPEY